MQFNDFCDYVCENISEYLPECSGLDAEIRDTTKSNGVSLKSLCVRDDSFSEYGSNIYLDYYYKKYMDKMNIEKIMEDIAEEYRRSREQIKDRSLDLGKFTEPDLDRIVPRILNYEKNIDQLGNCPYIVYQDLVITFRLVGDVTARDMMSVLVDNKMMNKMGMTPQELFHPAMENYKREFPPMLTSLGTVLSSLIGDVPDFMMENTPEREIYVLSNKQNINGATTLLDDDTLERAAEELGGNYYILPSSVHECLLVPEGFANQIEDLTSMVHDINCAVVSDMDFLSDTVYHYDAMERKITMVNPPESLTRDLDETRSMDRDLEEELSLGDDLDRESIYGPAGADLDELMEDLPFAPKR